MKKVFSMFARIVCFAVLAAGVGHAFAGTANSVKNAPGTIAYGTDQLISVEKDVTTTRVKARYSSGIQYVQDNASWTTYAKLVAGFKVAVAAPTSTTGMVYDISQTNGVYCQNSQTIVAWPNTGGADYVADNCALHTAVMQASQ
jgi:hypothetical protein